MKPKAPWPSTRAITSGAFVASRTPRRNAARCRAAASTAASRVACQYAMRPTRRRPLPQRRAMCSVPVSAAVKARSTRPKRPSGRCWSRSFATRGAIPAGERSAGGSAARASTHRPERSPLKFQKRRRVSRVTSARMKSSVYAGTPVEVRRRAVSPIRRARSPAGRVPGSVGGVAEAGAAPAFLAAARPAVPIASLPRNVRRGVALFIVVLPGRSSVRAPPFFYHGRRGRGGLESQPGLQLDRAVPRGRAAPGPRPKPPPLESDWPNDGELRLPTGVPAFAWLKTFWA